MSLNVVVFFKISHIVGILLVIYCAKSVQHGVFSGPYFPAFGPNIGIYGPEKTPYG